MTPGVRPLLAGNWKMNGVTASLAEIVAIREAADRGEAGLAELAICPPATLIAPASAALAGGTLALGGQDCHALPNGAFTGDIAAPMLKDAGCAYVIVGHSERRAGHAETDAMVCAKAEAAIKAGLTAIVCVGETRAERFEGRAIVAVGKQVMGSLPWEANPGALVVAYEPIWAIGAGVTPTATEVTEMHASIRVWLKEIYGAAGDGVRILYGGSVKPGNARELMGLPNVDGALVGGASLKAVDFLAIAEAYVVKPLHDVNSTARSGN